MWWSSFPFSDITIPLCGGSLFTSSPEPLQKARKRSNQNWAEGSVERRLQNLGFPGGSEVKVSACNGRRPKFDPWVGKIPWKRKWQPTPVFLPGESHGRRSLVGYSPQGRKKSDTTERLQFQFIELQISADSCLTMRNLFFYKVIDFKMESGQLVIWIWSTSYSWVIPRRKHC